MTYFFIGVAGSGMSALAQFLAMQGHKVLGSDRLFTQQPEHPIIKQLQKTGIETYQQGQAQIPNNATVIVSTAIEETVPEYKQAVEKKLTILHRTDLLKQITTQYRTIAVTGTSGKSTTTAMIFHILQYAGLEPSLITGAPLIHLQNKGLIGNAWFGKGEWLVIEADESDGTATKYHPEIGVLLNLDLDHKSRDEIKKIFEQFAANSGKLVINKDDVVLAHIKHPKQTSFCVNSHTPCTDKPNCNFCASDIKMKWTGLEFKINDLPVKLPLLGLHNAQNAVAAVAAATLAGIEIQTATKALEKFHGIFRRMQVIYRGIDFSVIDDFAHNPAKIKSALQSAQQLSNQVIAWFQPHGFSPLKLWGDELVNVLVQTLREQDIFVMSKVYYAGGTAPKDVCARDYIEKLKQAGKKAFFIENRKHLPDFIKPNAQPPTVVLLMGARDPMLDIFANYVSNYVIYFDGV